MDLGFIRELMLASQVLKQHHGIDLPWNHPSLVQALQGPVEQRHPMTEAFVGDPSAYSSRRIKPYETYGAQPELSWEEM